MRKYTVRIVERIIKDVEVDARDLNHAMYLAASGVGPGDVVRVIDRHVLTATGQF